MDNLGIVLMLAGFVLSFCCAINAIRGKPNKKIWYGMIAAYIGFGICYAISERDARNIGIAFMLICFCYIVKVVWGFLKAAIKHEKYHCKKEQQNQKLEKLKRLHHRQRRRAAKPK